jgi:hypothetical protein
MIRAYTDFHTYVLGVLFKAWNIFFALIYLFCFSFILLSFFKFLKDSNFFLGTQDERTGWMTYLITLASPHPSMNEAQ